MITLNISELYQQSISLYQAKEINHSAAFDGTASNFGFRSETKILAM